MLHQRSPQNKTAHIRSHTLTHRQTQSDKGTNKHEKTIRMKAHTHMERELEIHFFYKNQIFFR